MSWHVIVAFLFFFRAWVAIPFKIMFWMGMKIDVPWIIRCGVDFMQFTTQPESMKIWQDRGFLEVLFSAIVYPWPLLFFGWHMFGAVVLIFVLMSVCSQITHRLFLNIILFECQCAAYVFVWMRKNTKANKERYIEMANKVKATRCALHLWWADPQVLFFMLLNHKRRLYRQSREGELYPNTICLLTRIDTVHFVLGFFRVCMMLLFWFLQQPHVLECLSMCLELACTCLAECMTNMTWIVDILNAASNGSQVFVHLKSRVYETGEKMYADLFPQATGIPRNITKMRLILEQDEESSDMKQDARSPVNVAKMKLILEQDEESADSKQVTRIPLNVTKMKQILEQDEESDEADTSTDE
jgi:hypothetical protein